ncbi:protein phosphatase 1 regulatory subunit 32 isoform X2 [Hemicordylus capensis]|uniref:protein phosphatase 1 regulatory subunit 32 isoform X2 n=1 Tax=Hemicordylus capensis TaxID=884348 RepID=UPI002302C380|nr:protein phosphatase 1 regulatory subunit 32 isoform X2 [Hemicordylus capensis]
MLLDFRSTHSSLKFLFKWLPPSFWVLPAFYLLQSTCSQCLGWDRESLRQEIHLCIPREDGASPFGGCFSLCENKLWWKYGPHDVLCHQLWHSLWQLLQDNYESTHTKHFQPLQLPDGKYPLPWSVYQPGSGYVREKPLTFPTTKTVKKVHFDTRDQGPQAVTGLEPKHTPILHKLVGRGSVDTENARHGPQYMSTEYSSKFRFNIPGQPDVLQKKTIGSKEETGFTEGCLTNPIVCKQRAQESTPGISITKTDYLPSSFAHGDEFLPVLSKGSERGSGFSRQKNLLLSDPASSEPQASLSHSQFQGLQRQPQTQTSLLGREYVGNKERSGFSANNLSYVTPAYDPEHPNRFLTSYNSKFYENVPKGVDREGWTRGGVQPQQAGGFATNNHTTDLGSNPNSTETLRHVHPHVGRTITTVDPFYRDSPHDHRFTALHQTTVPTSTLNGTAP